MKNVITEHIDIWINAQMRKNGAGRGNGSGNQSQYGIKKLRELILELAVRGKLVHQDPNDEPASVLLEKIAVEKARLIKEGKIKKQEPLPEIGEDEKPFYLPEGWEWTRLGVISLINPRNEAEDSLPVSFIPMDLITTSHLGVHGQEMRTWGSIKQGYTHFADGDIGIAKITPCFENGKAAIFSGLQNSIGAGTTELHVLRPLGNTLNARYALLYLKAPQFLLVGETKMTGTAGQKRVPKNFFAENPFPFPPLAEQHRIVAKVDELMAMCDQLEQQQTDSNAAHQALAEALLTTLTNAADQGAFSEAWQRIANHFDTLFTTEHSIDQLKQTILQLAVMGRLVPQDPNDEPASVLLEKISKERKWLIKEGRLNEQKYLPEIGEEEMPFQLPTGWVQAIFSEVSQEVSTGPFGTMIHKQDYVEGGIPLINPSHMFDSSIVEEPSIAVSLKKAETLSPYRLTNGDIVMARRGEVGRCALVTEREDGWLCGTGSFRLRFHLDICRRYILLLFKTDGVRSYLGGKSVGTTMINLNHGILNRLPILLPPAAEQYRIVAKVDELMALCDTLKTRLNAAQTTQIQLADTIVEQAVVRTEDI